MVKYVYDFVKKKPFIKLVLKNTYQLLNVAYHRKKSDIKNLRSIAKNYFFGFHDKCPWDSNNIRVLAHRALSNDSARKQGRPTEIGYFECDDLNVFKPVAETNAWNWQQGAMLQWSPFYNDIYFNDLDENSYARLIKFDMKTNQRIDIGPASAAVSPDGTLSATISFYRFGVGLSGYGYFGLKEEEGNVRLPEENGSMKIMSLSSSTNDSKVEISLKQCIALRERPSMSGAYHYVSHPQFSPDSKKVAFFHRWLHINRRVETHLIIVDLAKGERFVAQSGTMFSHFCWVNNDMIFGFYESREGVDRYGVFDSNGVDQQYDYSKILSADGHPNAHIDVGGIITDTYPDKNRLQHLFVLNGDLKHPTKNAIGAFYAPFLFQELFRADLHPRWDRSGSKIAIDCSFTGKRSLAIVNLMHTE